jgi:hypothetical protein
MFCVNESISLLIGRLEQMAKKLDGILIEVNGGLVSYVEVDGEPASAYYLIDWDCLLGDGDMREAWEALEEEVREFIRDRYPTEFAAIQRRLKEETADDKTQQS